MKVIHADNVNHALPLAIQMFREGLKDGTVRDVSPRGVRTYEVDSPVTTVYRYPRERILFLPERDANPFFHLFEALWILNGRDDVAPLAFFVKRMEEYSDDGTRFHGAYGARIFRYSQIGNVVSELSRDPTSRRAVIGIWQPLPDSGYTGRDMPCNCTVTFKIRAGALNMTVFNRSNDLILGAYGANVVQFSVLQEYVATLLGTRVGRYTHVSDSLHVYPGDAAFIRVWERLKSIDIKDPYDPDSGAFKVTAIDMFPRDPSWVTSRLERFWSDILTAMERKSPLHVSNTRYTGFPFLENIAVPMFNAYLAHRTQSADPLDYLDETYNADWIVAGREWIKRRQQPAEVA